MEFVKSMMVSGDCPRLSRYVRDWNWLTRRRQEDESEHRLMRITRNRDEISAQKGNAVTVQSTAPISQFFLETCTRTFIPILFHSSVHVAVTGSSCCRLFCASSIAFSFENVPQHSPHFHHESVKAPQPFSLLKNIWFVTIKLVISISLGRHQQLEGKCGLGWLGSLLNRQPTSCDETEDSEKRTRMVSLLLNVSSRADVVEIVLETHQWRVKMCNYDLNFFSLTLHQNLLTIEIQP